MDEQSTKEIIRRNTNQLAVFGTAIMLCFAAAMAILVVRSRRDDRRDRNMYNPSFERACAELAELADKGCKVSFDECLRPLTAKMRIMDAMDREKIAFGTHGVTQAKLDELEARAMALIASQKYAYLRANGGAKYPSDLALLEDVCYQVYLYRRPLPGGNPTNEELKQLLPPGVTKVTGCKWDGWDQE